MTRVGTLKSEKPPKEFTAFERNLQAIERHKEIMRGDDYFDAHGVKTKNKLLGTDQIFKFAHGNTKQKLTLFNFGKEKTYQRRTMQAYKRRLANLMQKTSGGMTINKLLAGMDRKKSKSGPKSLIYGTSRKQRIKDIKYVQFEKMAGNIAHFKVSASGMTKGAPSHYKFQMQFPGWSRARTMNPGIKGVEQVLQEPVLIYDSCKDFQFMYGFIADSAGYAMQSEQSYPKVKNPKLQNTMCKHGGRVCEAIKAGEFSLKIYLANAMKAQAKKKQNNDNPLWAKSEKSKLSKKKSKESEFKRETKRKAKSVRASAKAVKKAQQTKAYKDFTKKEKDKLFKKLPKIVQKAASSKPIQIEKAVKDFAKKENIDPKKAARFARSGIKEIMEQYQNAASKAVKSAKSLVKSQNVQLVANTKIKGDLVKAKSYRDKFGDEVYQDMLKDIAKESGKSISELKKMVK